MKNRVLILSSFVTIAFGIAANSLAQSNSEGSVDLNTLELPKIIPKSSSKKPAAPKVDWIESSITTTFKDHTGSDSLALKQKAKAWLKSFQRDPMIVSSCGAFDPTKELYSPNCNTGSRTCQIFVATERCEFMDQVKGREKTSCPPDTVARYSPDPKHQNFKLCVKESGSAAPSRQGSDKAR